MHRIDGTGVSSTRPTPKPAGTAGFFTGGDPVTGVPGTQVTSDFLNAIMEEFAQTIELSGQTLSKSSTVAQLPAAIMDHAARSRVGELVAWAGTSAPPRALLANGANVSRVTFAALFAKIGTSVGAGDGVNTFTLPNATSMNVNTATLKITYYIFVGV